MKSSKYIDISAINQVIGGIYVEPSLLNKDDKYTFQKEDFVSTFHQGTFAMLYNLYNMGTKSFSFEVLSDYLAQRPKFKAEFEANKGYEYLLKIKDNVQIESFDYYYSRLRKMTLFRGFEEIGMNLDWLYNPDDIMNPKKVQEQEEFVDSRSLGEISDIIIDKLESIKTKYVTVTGDNQDAQLGDGALELLDELKESPAFGIPFYTKYMNTITRGARLGRFFLRSAPTGAGKSRSMIADICYWGTGQMYDLDQNKWVTTGAPQSCLYIATEQDLQEITTMALSFIAGVDEEHILENTYYVGEEDRVRKAAQILKGGKVYFVCIPDFSLQDIENIIKKYIREKQVQYIGFDYIHSSPRILQLGSGIKNLREDSVLFLLSSHLKDLCVQYGVFIMSSTQLNASWTECEEPDQNCLRGSKAIADRIDVGTILLEATKEDKEKLQPFCAKNGLSMPNMKLSIYKNRQGQHRGEYLWLYADKGACRFNGAFMTKWDYSFIEVPDIKIKVQEESIF